MAGPFQGLGDPSAFEGLPLPASPVTSAGEDPDEVRELMAQRAAIQGRQLGAAGPQLSRTAPVEQQVQQQVQPVPQAQPAGPVATPASNVEPTGLNADTARQAMSGQLQAGRRLADTAEDEQADPAIQRLQDQKLQDEQASPNAKDPQYRAGFGTRLLRGLRGAGMGFAQGGFFGAAAGAIDPALTAGGKGYGAPTDAYDTALAAQQKRVAGDTEALSNAQNLFKTAEDLRKQRAAGFKDSGDAFKGAGATATTQEGEENKAAQLPIDQEKADSERQTAQNNSPAGKLQLTQQQIDQRTEQANKQRMSGIMRTRYILTGEIQPTREATSEEIAVNRILGTWSKSHGGQPPQTVQEWQSVYAAAKGGTGAAGGDGGKDLREAASLAQKNLKGLQAQKSAKGYILLSDEEKSSLENDITEASNKYNELRTRLEAGGPAPAAAGAPTPQPAAAAPPAGAPGGGAMVRMKLPDGRFARIPKANVAHAKTLGAVEAGGN